jgi:hypothetical protein
VPTHHQLEHRKNQVIRLLAQDLSNVEVVKRLAPSGLVVDESSIRAFRRRHALEIETQRGRIIEKAATEAGLTKAERLRSLDGIALRLEARLLGGGFDGDVLELARLVRELRETLRLIALERGELGATGPDGQGPHAATASAQALVVMVDGKQVDDENAQRAAARAMFERFRLRPSD